jgi:long-chain acyl-CoA synthetase
VENSLVLGNPPSLAAFYDIWRRSRGEFLRFEGGARPSRLTYDAAARSAAGFALRMRAFGIGKGERIVLWGENRPAWVVALWGCLLEGVIAVPIDFRSSPALVTRIAGLVEARALLIGDGLVAPTGMACPVWPVDTVLGLSTPVDQFTPAAPADVAEVLFTSGATGDPKGVQITHRNILANLEPIDGGIAKYRRYIRIFSPIRFLNLLPLSHMFGQAMAAFIPPMIAGDVYFMSGYSPRDVVHLIHRRRVSVLVCVPQMLELLRDHITGVLPEAGQPARSAKWYVNWWQYRAIHRRFGFKFWAFVVGAAPLDPAVEQFWRKLGFLVIQGYGLTETAPIATLNHPFDARAGTVGKAISGVEIRIAPDGEVLLRGDNVTPGYFGKTAAALVDAEGWLHTGDIGELDSSQRLKILGRKKEMIISPDGLNVYPEDVERVLNALPGVRESAVVAAKDGTRESVHAVLVLDAGASADAVVTAANGQLEPHQRIRGFSVWPDSVLPRTSGTGKLKRVEIATWVGGAGHPVAGGSSVEDIIRKFAPGRQIGATTSLDELGLSSLDRIQLMMELEKRTGTAIDESQFAAAHTISDLARVQPASAVAGENEFEFPEWSRGRLARAIRRAALPLVLPLARLFAWIRVEGLENLRDLEGPVIFASNHQSHFDVPSIYWAMPSRWRYRVAPAMAKEFFDAHFHPARYKPFQRFTNGLNYFLAVLVFNCFPLPQREAGARESLRYGADLAADGYSILIFPEGKRTDKGELLPFQPGVGMLASRLRLPVVPVRLEGLERVLHKDAKFPTPGRAQVKFGPAMHIEGDDYAALAKKVEEAVRAL